MAIKKVYLAGIGPYLVDDGLDVDDPDGDWSGEKDVGLRTDSQVVATEFIGVPISAVSVVDIDDPSDELNLLSASQIGGLIAVYQPSVAANDPFTLYLWDTDAAAEDVPYSVDGDGGTWIAVGGKYRSGDVYVSGDINYGGSLGDHASTHENGGGDEISVAGLSGTLADDQHVIDSEVEAVITAELVDGQSIDNAIDSLIATHAAIPNAHHDWTKVTANGVTLGGGPPTSSDAVADLQTAHDGNTYTATEIAGNAGQYLIVDFTSVTAFNWVQILARYQGSSTHVLTVSLEITPFDGSTWHTYNVILDQPADQDFQNFSFFVPNDAAYINSGVVKVRISHDMSGTAGHEWVFDVVALYI